MHVNETVKRIKSLEYLQRRLAGETSDQIAKSDNVSHDKVTRLLSWGEKAGLFAQFQDELMTKLMPAATKAILDAMQDGDAQVALEIFKMAGMQPQTNGKSQKSAQSDGEDDDGGSLLTYVNRLRDQAQIEQNTLEGELIGEQRLLGESVGSSRETVGDGTTAASDQVDHESNRTGAHRTHEPTQAAINETQGAKGVGETDGEETSDRGDL